MYGFTDKALITLPDYDTYMSRNDSYKYRFRVSVDNIIKYLNKNNIQPYGLYTDDLMRQIRPEGVKLISTLSTADSFFAAKNVQGMTDALTIPKWENQAIIDKYTSDLENAADMEPLERFKLLLKHDKKVARALIASFNVVFIFNFSKKNYTATSKPNDQNIRVYIDAITLVPKVFMGGVEVDACDVLNLPSGNWPVADWRL